MRQSLIGEEISDDTDVEITLAIYEGIKLDPQHSNNKLCIQQWKVCKSVDRLSFRPLRKMAVGMIFAALAFGAATLVEVNVVVRMSSNRESSLF